MGAKSGVWLGGVVLGVLLASGAMAEPGKEKGKGVGGSGGVAWCEQESQSLQQLESDARSLASAEGCTDVSQCRAAPVGVRACGGPRDYLVYCSVTSDEDALQKMLTQLQRDEDRYNRQCGISSICIFLEEPRLELVNGVCQAVSSSPTELP